MTGSQQCLRTIWLLLVANVREHFAPFVDRIADIAGAGVLLGPKRLVVCRDHPLDSLLYLSLCVDVLPDVITITGRIEVLRLNVLAGFIKEKPDARGIVGDAHTLQDLKRKDFDVEGTEERAVTLVPAFQHLYKRHEPSMVLLVGSGNQFDVLLGSVLNHALVTAFAIR